MLNVCFQHEHKHVELAPRSQLGATENTGPAKSRGIKMQDLKMMDQIAGHKNARRENARLKI